MPDWKLSKRSLDNLVGVHPDLQSIVRRALELSPYDFGISEGVRTLERQIELVKARKSRTMASRHLTGHAVDFFVLFQGKVTWEFRYYEAVSKAFKLAAEELGVKINWGGDWKNFKDGPHIELART